MFFIAAYTLIDYQLLPLSTILVKRYILLIFDLKKVSIASYNAPVISALWD